MINSPDGAAGTSAHRPVLALMGSPRRNGNSNILVDETLAVVAEAGIPAEKVVLRDLKISPCLEIYQCMKSGQCAIKDDMIGLFDKLLAARVVILATPVFFYGPSAIAKAAIDRCQALWARKYVLKQEPKEPRGQGYLISVGATNGKKLFDGIVLTSTYFFDCLNLDLSGQVLVRGADQAGDVKLKPDALEEARVLGRRIVESMASSSA